MAWVEADADALADFGRVKTATGVTSVYDAKSWPVLQGLVRQALSSDRALNCVLL